MVETKNNLPSSPFQEFLILLHLFAFLFSSLDSFFLPILSRYSFWTLPRHRGIHLGEHLCFLHSFPFIFYLQVASSEQTSLPSYPFGLKHKHEHNNLQSNVTKVSLLYCLNYYIIVKIRKSTTQACSFIHTLYIHTYITLFNFRFSSSLTTSISNEINIQHHT